LFISDSKNIGEVKKLFRIHINSIDKENLMISYILIDCIESQNLISSLISMLFRRIEISFGLLKCLFISRFIRKTIRFFELLVIHITHVVFYFGHIRHINLLCAGNIQMNFIRQGNWRTIWIFFVDIQQERNIDLNVEHVLINNDDTASNFVDDKLSKRTKIGTTHSNTQSKTVTVSHSR